MERYYAVAIVTLISSLAIFGMALTVARTHKKTGILAPRMTGDPLLERAIRAHSNTIEWLPVFLPSMWLFAIYWDSNWAAAFGLMWLIGRIAYFLGYVSAPLKRYPVFSSKRPQRSHCCSELWAEYSICGLPSLNWFDGV